MNNISREELESIVRRSSPGVGTVVAGMFLYDVIDFFLRVIFEMLPKK